MTGLPFIIKVSLYPFGDINSPSTLKEDLSGLEMSL
jgi:hypothetical protein